jgi:hypothetical protein
MLEHNPLLESRPKKIYPNADLNARKQNYSDDWKTITGNSSLNVGNFILHPKLPIQIQNRIKTVPKSHACHCPCINLTTTDCKNVNKSLIGMNSDEWEYSEKYYKNVFDLSWPANYLDDDYRDRKDDDDNKGFYLYHYCPTEAWFKVHPFKEIQVTKEISNKYSDKDKTITARLPTKANMDVQGYIRLENSGYFTWSSDGSGGSPEFWQC